MRAKQWGRRQNTRELVGLIRPLRELAGWRNLVYLLIDYVTLAVVLTATVFFLESRGGWGISVWWNLAVLATAVVLVGALQHRLAGLGHEAAHYSFLDNRRLNDLVSDLCCMFPILATTHQYRLAHQAHHQFTNDWERDPDLSNIGRSKLMDRFPMTRGQFVYHYFVRFLLPPVLFKYLWDIVYLSGLGKGQNPYLKAGTGTKGTGPIPLAACRRAASGCAQHPWGPAGPLARRAASGGGKLDLSPASLLGTVHLAGLAGAMMWANHWGSGALLLAVPVVGLLAAGGFVIALPQRAFFQSPIKPDIPVKVTAFLRVGFYTAVFFAFAGLRHLTGRNWGAYFWLLWVLPLSSSFAYFMLLRDVYQHANADDGKLTNTRVFFTDPFTRWAVFVYGQDMHVPHHLYPMVPHYNLPKLHRLLAEQDAEYAQHVVECHGTFRDRRGRPTILDVLEHGTREPAGAGATSRPNRQEGPSGTA